ncbi:serine/threonine-protein kinase pim-2-like [Oratosquilla oratoria]|uniref:serine/threonine-protein kinase pim-2-like n=1 Tax=Oratosquilla oratoria TaxID=337810 RepID=UPI003F75C14A
MVAVLLERLQHIPGVIELYEYMTVEGSFFMVMELPPGAVSLSSYMRSDNGEPLSMDEVKRLFGKNVETVQSCLVAGVSHKDIKPENVLLFRDESTGELDIRLIDFSCWEMAERHWGTFTGGTPHCWPPQFIRSRRFLHTPAAVWSLGALLYHIVCRQDPFDSVASVRRASPPFPSNIPRPCRDLIMRCFEKDPWNRPSFCGILSHPWMTGLRVSCFRLETARAFKKRNPKAKKEGQQGLCRHVVSRVLSSVKWCRLC